MKNINSLLHKLNRKWVKVLSIIILIIFSIFIINAATKEHKTIVTDLQYKSISGELFAFKEGKAFHGDAWSNDEKTYMLFFEKGILQKIRYFHDNGETFYFKIITRDYSNRHFTNEYGVSLSEEQAQGLYPDLYTNLKKEMRNLDEIINSHPHN